MAHINLQTLSNRLHSSARSPLVIVLDIHGVLVDRVPRKAKQRLKTTRQISPSYQSSRNYVTFLRPHLRLFLSTLFSRHSVGLWSSAQQFSIQSLISSFHRDIYPNIISSLEFIWDRSRCRPDTGTGPYATVKYLPDLWMNTNTQKNNSLLLDDSASKFRHYPTSGIVVPEYNIELLQDDYRNDDTLLWLLLYIEHLLDIAERNALTNPEKFCIAQARATGMSFSDFIREGKRQARQQLPNAAQTNLAAVFFPSISPLSPEPIQTVTQAPIQETGGPLQTNPGKELAQGLENEAMGNNSHESHGTAY